MSSDLPSRPRFKLGVYVHYKGNTYQAVDLVLHSETLQWYVLYRPLYGTSKIRWVRPHSMFVEEVVHQGTRVPRFTYRGAA